MIGQRLRFTLIGEKGNFTVTNLWNITDARSLGACVLWDGPFECYLIGCSFYQSAIGLANVNGTGYSYVEDCLFESMNKNFGSDGNAPPVVINPENSLALGAIIAGTAIAGPNGAWPDGSKYYFTNAAYFQSPVLTYLPSINGVGSDTLLRIQSSSNLFNFTYGGGLNLASLTASGPISGNGASVTSLNAGNLASGTVPTARLAALGAQYANALTNNNSYSAVFTAGITAVASSIVGANASPAASAVWEMRSTTQGMLPPRMTKAQRNTISSPATGLVVFQTDGNVGLHQWDGANWDLMAFSADP